MARLRRLTGLPGIALLVMPCALAAGQAAAAEPVATIVPRAKPKSVEKADDVLRADSLLVVIPARVTTPDGAPVTGLRQENFAITENDVAQTIAHFAQDDAPVSVGLLVDISASMKPKMTKAAEAAAAFFRTSNPEDEFFLVEFSDQARLCVPFTNDPDLLFQRIEHTRPSGRTALLDAVYLGIRQMKRAKNKRRALVIFSDGGDNWSWHTAHEVKKILLETDVQVYAMGIPADEAGVGISAEERNGPKLLSDLAEQSGGRHYPVKRLQDLPEISAKIGNQLRSEYLLGFYPAHLPLDGKYHQVNVQLQVPDNTTHMRADYRQGYYAPVR